MIARNPPSVTTFVSCAYWREKRQLISQNQFRKFNIPSRVFRSYEPQETRSNSVSGGKDKLLIDCGPEQECVLGGVVALGKFDALHIGHRQLAIQAAKAGVPFLLSFVGIAEVLGWEYRASIVAKCDRKRVLSSWAHYCGNVVPQEYGVNFAAVRYLSPRQFVERLAVDLGVSGVVAGENYRFGYKASGDASDLVKLCEEYSLEAHIVSPVMDDHLTCHNGRSAYTSKREKVSSTGVRHALAMGDMEYVEQLLGRKHRLVLAIEEGCFSGNTLSIAKSCMLNQPPKEGLYENCSLLIDDKFVGPCRVIHDSENIHVEIHNKIGSSSQRSYITNESISIEFV